MNEQKTTPPDMIQQAGELLRRFKQAEPIVDWDLESIDMNALIAGDSAVVVASAILAAAGEIRELRNVLADGLLAELVRTDADNAALIERLHQYEPIAVPE